ncbi:hypothetical protein FACS189468_2210 [Spirochaetia bacterium]|nr:hypothetical protein FACS189468_2210 [Spirochaetia bacterium]
MDEKNKDRFNKKSLLSRKLNALDEYRRGHLDEARALLHDCFDTIDAVDEVNAGANPEHLDAALWRELCAKALEAEPDFAILYMVMGSLIYQMDGDVVGALKMMRRVLPIAPKDGPDYEEFIDALNFANRCDDQALGIVSHK